MKKIFLLLTIMGAVLITGCGDSNDQEVVTYNREDIAIQNEKDTTTAAETQTTEGTITETTAEAEKDSSASDNSDDTTVESVSDDKFAYTVHDCYMDLDSDKGPYYIIDLDTMSVVDCTSSGARVVDYKKDGDILTITLYSNEYPVNSTYVVDLSKSTDDTVTEQSIKDNVLSFSSEKGPDYVIDLNTMKLVSCSDNTGRIVSSELDGDKLTLVLYSKTLPVDMTYEFTIK